ncbi:MAG: hypothetical protein ACI4M3_08040 [Acutalibacteraceae bacterium]
MKIELNAGGLSGFVAIADFQIDMRSAYNKVEDVVEAFQSVRQSVCNLNGGVGNLQDALNDIQARINIETQRIEKIETVQRCTNDFLSLAITIDMRVARKIDSNRNEFYGRYAWSRPSVENVLENIWEGLKDFCDDVVDFLKDTKDMLVDWYENHGGKELFHILSTIAVTALAVTGLVLSLIPPATGVGVATIISIFATYIAVKDAELDIFNEVQAFGKKREALKAEANGDHEKAEKLRSEASALSDESSWRDRWRNDGKDDIWDWVATGCDVIEILDVVSSGSSIISDIGKAGSVSKWFSEGISSAAQLEKLRADKVVGNLDILSKIKVADFAVNNLANFSIGTIGKIKDGTISTKQGWVGFNIETPKFNGGTSNLFVPVFNSPALSSLGIIGENLKNFLK